MSKTFINSKQLLSNLRIFTLRPIGKLFRLVSEDWNYCFDIASKNGTFSSETELRKRVYISLVPMADDGSPGADVILNHRLRHA